MGAYYNNMTPSRLRDLLDELEERLFDLEEEEPEAYRRRREMENLIEGTIKMDDWNPNGGAIAFGHPNGASGTRITMHAIKELRERGGGYGLVSTCCGGGLGVSTLIEVL